MNGTRFVIGIQIAVILGACGGGGGRDIVEPPPTNNTFVLSVRANDQDLSVAQKLGWTSGIPNAEVVLTSTDGSGAPRNLTTSAAGTVSIAALPTGKYRVAIRRILTAAEIATINEASGPGAFVGESEIEVTAGSLTATVSVPVSYRSSLVISEWSFNARFFPGIGSYRYGGFLELYNNSDTTVYLDGVLLVNGHEKPTHQPGTFADCNLYKPYQNDPDGVWSQFMQAFPGTGRDYPLAAGKTVVVATDAIDHRPISAGELDLRGAHFEFIGSADVDNPQVPNMVERGVREFFYGHGLIMGSSLATVTGVSLPRAAATFVKANLPPNATEHVRIPRQDMLDVFTSISTWMSRQQPPIGVCPELVHASMDRQYATLMDDTEDDWAVSFSRRILRTLPNGQHVLQHTRNSANDFQRTPRTPGVVSP